MANPRKFSEKIALHNQKQAEETAAFEKIMREVSDATNKVQSTSRRPRVKANIEITEKDKDDTTLRPNQQSLGTYRSGSLPNVAAPQATNTEPENDKPEETSLAAQYGLSPRSGGASPSRSPGQRGRASSSVGPMRRPSDRKHDTSPYGSTVYLSPPPDSSWRRTNSDSALHQSCGGEAPAAPPLSPHPLHSHQHPHLHPHQNHRGDGDINLDQLTTMRMNPNNRPRSSCEIPRIPNNNNVYGSGCGVGNPGDGDGGGGVPTGGGLLCSDLQLPGGSLPDLTSLHYPPHYRHRTSPDYTNRYSPTSPGAVSPGAGSVSPATGGLSPASGSPVGATVPLSVHQHDPTAGLYDTQNHLSVPNTNNYLHHNKGMSPLDHHGWISSGYPSHCSPPSQYSSTSNINVPSPTMVHSPGSPVESPQNDYNNLHQVLLQPFEQITMMDAPTTNYNTSYMNHNSPHSPQPANAPHTYSQQSASYSSDVCLQSCSNGDTRTRDPVPGAFPLPSPPQAPATPASIPDIILTDYSGELDAGMFGGEEAQLRAGLDLDDLTLLEEPSALMPDSDVEHGFRLDRL